MGKQIQRGVRLLRCSMIIYDHRPCSPHFKRVETEGPAPSRHSTHPGEEGPMQSITAVHGQDSTVSLGPLAQAGFHTLPFSLFPRNEVTAHIHHKEGEYRRARPGHLPSSTGNHWKPNTLHSEHRLGMCAYWTESCPLGTALRKPGSPHVAVDSGQQA